MCARWLGVLLLSSALAGPAVADPTGREPDPAEEPTPAYLKREPLKPAPGDTPLRKLEKERFNAALAAAQARYLEYLSGRGTIEITLDSVQRLADAELALTDKPAERVAILERGLGLYRDAEKVAELRFEAGKITLADREEARYLRLNAEIRLLREKEKK